MKQYRITAADFADQYPGIPDAVCPGINDVTDLKRLAGLQLAEDYYEAGGHDPALTTPNDSNPNPISPVGTTQPDASKRQIEREQNIKVGSPEWFRLWFAKPELTGEKPVGDAPAPVTPGKSAD